MQFQLPVLGSLLGIMPNTNMRAECFQTLPKFVIHHSYAWQQPALSFVQRHQLSQNFQQSEKISMYETTVPLYYLSQKIES